MCFRLFWTIIRAIRDFATLIFKRPSFSRTQKLVHIWNFWILQLLNKNKGICLCKSWFPASGRKRAAIPLRAPPGTPPNFSSTGNPCAHVPAVVLQGHSMFLLHLQASQVGATSVIHYMVRLVLLTLCGWVLCWTLVNLFRSHSVLNLLFLGYPWVIRPCTFMVGGA